VIILKTVDRLKYFLWEMGADLAIEGLLGNMEDWNM
jgi:hypothetical protein